jgi:hypothetical protein
VAAATAPDLSHLRLSLPARLASAAPDLALAGLFLWCWRSPVAWRPTLASELGILMLMEFFAIHAGIFFFFFAAGGVFVLLVLLAVYLAVGGAFIYFHGGWWPALALGWLLASQAISAAVLGGRGPATFAKKRQFFYWSQGAACYILLGAVAVMLPMPRMGFASPHARGYVWDSWWRLPPHEVMAWGFLAFGALGLIKLLEKPEWIEGAVRTEAR